MKTPVYSSQPSGPRRVAHSQQPPPCYIIPASSLQLSITSLSIYGHVIVSGPRVIRQASMHTAMFCSPAPPFLPLRHPPPALYHTSLHLTLTLDPHILTPFTLTLHPHPSPSPFLRNWEVDPVQSPWELLSPSCQKTVNKWPVTSQHNQAKLIWQTRHSDVKRT